MRKKHYLQELVDQNDNYDQIMDKLYKREREKIEKEDWEREKEAEKLFKLERERHEKELRGSPI